MPLQASWIAARLPMLRMIGLGVATAPVSLGLAWVLVPPIAPIAAPADRLVFAVQLAAAPTLVLLAILQSLWRIVDTDHAEDPFAGKESRRWKVNARVFQNSIEQWLLFVPMLLALSTRIAPDRVRGLVALVVVWCAGRVLFWVGYHVDPKWRAPGMDWTFAATVVAVVWFLATFV